MDIKELREKYGLTRKQLSERYGIPYRTIQDWELGNRKCPDYALNLLRLDLERTAK